MVGLKEKNLPDYFIRNPFFFMVLLTLLRSDNVLHSCCICQTDRQMGDYTCGPYCKIKCKQTNKQTAVCALLLILKVFSVDFHFSHFPAGAETNLNFACWIWLLSVISMLRLNFTYHRWCHCSCFACGFPNLLDHYSVVSVLTNHSRHLIKGLKT